MRRAFTTWTVANTRAPHAPDADEPDDRTAGRAPRDRIVGIDHLQLSMPPRREDDVRVFYGSVLGLREVQKPAALAGRGGCWFANDAVAIHLGVDRDHRPLAKAHPALVVRDLAAARAALAASQVPIEDDDSGLGVQRFYVRDPFGNRLEMVDAAGAGFSVR